VGQILHLIPVGDVDEDILTFFCRELQDSFGKPCEVAPSLPHPSYAYDRRRKQYRSDWILRQVTVVSLPDTYRLLAVADLDLFVPDLNFVFGQANVGGREAIIALPRLRQEFYGLPPDEALFQERAVKEAVHEIGHTHRLAHCPDLHCVMRFSNFVADTDIKGRAFCVKHQAKLRTRLGQAPLKS